MEKYTIRVEYSGTVRFVVSDYYPVTSMNSKQQDFVECPLVLFTNPFEYKMVRQLANCVQTDFKKLKREIIEAYVHHVLQNPSQRLPWLLHTRILLYYTIHRF